MSTAREAVQMLPRCCGVHLICVQSERSSISVFLLYRCGDSGGLPGGQQTFPKSVTRPTPAKLTLGATGGLTHTRTHTSCWSTMVVTFSGPSCDLQDYYQSGRMLLRLSQALGRIVLAGREMTRLSG